MKLQKREVLLEAENYACSEPMKHRFKHCHIPWAYSLEEMPFNDSIHEFGIRRKAFITKKNERVRKPYWRKKRRQQKRERNAKKTN